MDAEMAQEEILWTTPAFLRQIIEKVAQHTLEAEMTVHLGAQALRSASAARTGQRNGHKSRTLRARVRTLTLLVPHHREGPFPTSLFACY
jgi:putative transposase